MEPLGGIEPRTILPALRTGLEDLCWGKGLKSIIQGSLNRLKPKPVALSD